VARTVIARDAAARSKTKSTGRLSSPDVEVRLVECPREERRVNRDDGLDPPIAMPAAAVDRMLLGGFPPGSWVPRIASASPHV